VQHFGWLEYMIEDRYLSGKSPAPSKLKQLFDEHVIPVAIDAAGSVEAVLERLGQSTRRQPIVALGLAVGAGFLLSMLRGERRGRNRHGVPGRSFRG
jgi:hypothetical protein